LREVRLLRGAHLPRHPHRFNHPKHRARAAGRSQRHSLGARHSPQEVWQPRRRSPRRTRLRLGSPRPRTSQRLHL